MVAKKRTTLRNKAASKKPNNSLNGSEAVFHQLSTPNSFPEDPKAFLHQLRETKKEKQMNKQDTFLTQIKERAAGNPDFAGISKSSIRRRKRNMKNDLKPKMNDLLLSLNKEAGLKEILENDHKTGSLEDEDMMVDTNVTKITKSTKYRHINNETSASVKIKKNQPSIRNQKGAKQLTKDESKRFVQVLNNNAFKADPFGSLKEIIKMQKF
ncbi:hypothetical protein TPHA_0M01690 [Tetrapisispora phaffii CBS 4417]|uniref:Ribosome biogenesis protein SLX9 n=1 Tax=Tetrapisispora phaffii (strain ATCC 24235 / CBS 4417 / NBRC 1672 / NRRL Y-8282 / UCD 70-5) TaxID=1071381 RepID=G8C0M9_TETPH|nr:hypothetical protein TPHA_0M01690 [Tetrapisispora phaffii CBS 4417]CCE65744.1 hypothetical protein TPHA_0M01690 [Tetrapisispora phaffii CBS 4417]